MSSFRSERSGRADARRNAARILNATAELLAADPAVSLEQVATHAGVSRATLYHHFAGRDALLDALTGRSIAEVTAAVRSARPGEGPAVDAMERVLRAAWQVVGRYRGLVLVNPRRLARSELRHRLAPALAPIRTLIRRGRRSGEFDPELPVEWTIGVITDLIHAASGQVSTGAMRPQQAERVLLRTAQAALTGHRASRSRG
ncbi:MAG TPA: TetR/AcrR family transcriptional regulator [Solirubrobacteraceae bacterium]|nr:TetR/AcrR family transcriptional regulator [Solirubrobacteraceae bacterium]